jgi:hypothetical protein
MTPDQLDDYLERVRAESASTAVPDGFTDRVMRAVRTPARRPATSDLWSSAVASGALVASGAMLWLSSSGAATVAAGLLILVGFVMLWVDDPFGAEMNVRLLPW